MDFGNYLAKMPRLVQVMAKQAQIPEEDVTKAHDLDFKVHNLKEVTLKAYDPNSDNHDMEEIAMKSRNTNFGNCQHCEHEGV